MIKIRSVVSEISILGRTVRNEDGIALISAVVFLVVIAVLAPVAVRMTSSEAKRKDAFEEQRYAFFNADAGFEKAKSIARKYNVDTLLAGPDGSTSTTNDNGTFSGTSAWAINTSSGITSYTGTYGAYNYTKVAPSDLNGGSYYIRIFNNKSGAINPATNGASNLFYIDSIGVSPKGKVKEIVALMAKVSLNPSAFPSAMTMVGASTTIDAQSNAYNVTGNAVDTSGNDDSTCADKYGLATETSTPTWSGSHTDNFEGTAPPAGQNAATCADGDASSSVWCGQTTFTAANAQALWASSKVYATSTYDSSGGQVNNVNFTGSPQVIYVSGSNGASVNGNFTGYGILIVDGPLRVSGNFTFNGLVLVGACPTCTNPTIEAATGNLKIYGAVVVGNAGVTSAATITGNATIAYSCAGLNSAASAFSNSISVVSWKEIS